MGKTLFDIVRTRRSIYSIKNSIPITDDQLTKIVSEAALHTPSPFNSQSSRTVLLLGAKHKKLWQIVEDAIRAVTTEDAFKESKPKIDGFAAGYGTILYFEEMDTVKGLQKQFESYKDNFPIWSLQSNGMLEYLIWLALAEEGIGASLQHYNELIEKNVISEFGFKGSWKLLAQMPFGAIVAPAGKKEFMDIKERLFILK